MRLNFKMVNAQGKQLKMAQLPNTDAPIVGGRRGMDLSRLKMPGMRGRDIRGKRIG